MSYGLIYKIPFAALRGEACMIEIELEGYTGAATELTAADSPFTVEIDDEEFLYTPTRFSNATIRVVGSDYLQSLFSTAYQQYRVTFKRNGTIIWCGFIKPEVYTQDYCSDKFELELECMSAMSTLEYINYQAEKEERQFVSLWSLLQKCIRSANGQYNAVYLPHVYASSAAHYNAGENVLEKMTISEQNFFDEDDEAMSLKEILEEICKLLNWTCCDWHGELYFVDMDHSGKYHRHDGNLSGKTGETTDTLLNVQTVGFAGTGHALDMLPGYNKATVRVSNYPISTSIPEEKFEELEELNTFDNETDDHKKACRRVFLLPENWNTMLFNNGTIMSKDDLIANKEAIVSYEGAIPMRYCTYNQHKDENGKFVPDITDYSFNNVIQIRYPKDKYVPGIKGQCKVMTIKGASAVYSDGAFCISGSLKTIVNEDLIPWGNSSSATYPYAQLRIGNMYYGSLRPDAGQKSYWAPDPELSFALHSAEGNRDESADYVSFENQKTLSMPYKGLNGIIIPIENQVFAGEFEFTLLSGVNMQRINGYLIKDFKLIYQKKDGLANDLDNTSDRYYENVVNESYINELDEIEFKISSYNNDGACYSKVMLGDKYLESNLYASVAEELIRPEELLIRRIVNRYDVPRIKLTQTIQETSELTPITRLSDNFMVNKIFINAGGSIDYKMGQFRCVMIEI